MQLLNRLVWDIRKTDDIMHYWRIEGKRNGVIATFIQSESGLTRIHPPSASHYLWDQTNPSRSLVFQRAFYGDDYVFFPPEPEYDVSSNQSDSVVTIVKTISFARIGMTYKPAVVGVMVDPLWLQTYLLSTPCIAGKVPISCSDDDIVCYIVDDGGFIISTNQPDLMNVMEKFLGSIDAEIMTELFEKKIYERNEDFNFEDRCRKEIKVSAGFRTSLIPFHSSIEALKISWLFDFATWSYLKYWFLSLFSLWKLPRSEALPKFYELANETTCNTHEAQYYWGRWGRSNSGDIFCNNCTRHYSLAKVNALLLLTSKPCAPLFCDPVLPLLQAKEEVLSTEMSPCDRPLRYRRRPDKCYSLSLEHKHNITHRDLKAENVFISSKNIAKIGDFGFSIRVQSPKEALFTLCNSPSYVAPEIFQNPHIHAGSAWMCGLLVYFMVSASSPFKGDTVSVIKKKILTGSFAVPKFFSKDCGDIISGLLQLEPEKRLSCHQIKNCAWLKGMPFPAVHGGKSSAIEKETREALEAMGITDKIFQEHRSKGARSSVIGTYRIILHKKEVKQLKCENTSDHKKILLTCPTFQWKTCVL